MKKLISEELIRDTARKGGKVILYDDETIITSAAREKAAQLGIGLERKNPSKTLTIAPDPHKIGAFPVVIGSDHGGFQLKEAIKPYLESLGCTVIDVGTDSENACDYPDFAYQVAKLVSDGKAQRGIMIDSVGNASAIVANKIPGIRAVACFNEFSARSSREHNDANVLTLGGKVIGTELAKAIVKVWVEAPFTGGRHQTRVEKITDIERKFLKSAE